MQIRTTLACLTALTVVAAASTAQAQENPVKWTAKAATPTGAPGSQTTVLLSATIEDGWHIYSITQGPGGPVPTKIIVPDSQAFSLAGAIKPGAAPNSKFDDSFGIQVETYENKASFAVPVKIAADAKPGEQTVLVKARYQVCNASICLPAKTESLSVPLTVKGGKSTKAKKA